MKTDQPFFRRIFILGHRSPPSSVYGDRAARLLEHGSEVVASVRARRRRPSPPGSRTPTSGCSSRADRVGLRRRDRRGSARGSRPAGPAGRHAVPDRLVLARACSRCGSPPTGRSTTSPSATSSPCTWCSTSTYSMHRGAAAAHRHADVAGPLAPVAAAGCSRTVRCLSRFLPAPIVFNVVIIVTHTPVVVNAAPRARAAALRAPHDADLRVVADRVDAAAEPAARGAAPATARPDAVPVPCSRSCRRCRRRSSRSARTRCTRSTTTCRGCSGRSALDDMQIAGLIMKIGVGLLLWALITIIFFRWTARRRAAQPPAGAARARSRAPRWDCEAMTDEEVPATDTGRDRGRRP